MGGVQIIKRGGAHHVHLVGHQGHHEAVAVEPTRFFTGVPLLLH